MKHLAHLLEGQGGGGGVWYRMIYIYIYICIHTYIYICMYLWLGLMPDICVARFFLQGQAPRPTSKEYVLGQSGELKAHLRAEEARVDLCLL